MTKAELIEVMAEKANTSKAAAKRALDSFAEAVTDALKGGEKTVTELVEQTGAGKDPWGNDRLGFSASGAIHRGEWGLKWNQALEAGGVLVSDKVEIEVEAQVVQGK